MIANLKDKIKNFGWPISITLLFGAICLAILVLSCYQIFKAEKTKSWRQAQANVKKVDYKTHDYHSSGRNSVTTYETLVTYEYWINSKKHIGNKIAIGYSISNVEEHDAVFATLDNAKKIVIYVNPDNAEEAVIVTGINNSIIFFLEFAIFFNSVFFLAILGQSFPKYLNFIRVLVWLIIIGVIYTILAHTFNIELSDKIKVIEQVIPNDDDEIEKISIYSPNKN